MNHLIKGTTLGLSLLAGSALAAVSPEQAAELGKRLTPLGAERAGNADGSIPEWTGGLPSNAGSKDGAGFLSNPYAAEKPLFVIDAKNVDKYKDKLSPGQLAMFKRYPDSYRMPVYPSHRSVSLPDAIYNDAKANALHAKMVKDGNGLADFLTAYPFPIPQNAQEVMWNHTTRYRGAVAACGLAQGMDFPASVASFILRGITLYGIDSVMAPQVLRREAWQRLARDLDLAKLDAITREISLGEALQAGRDILEGKIRGRVVVDVSRS